VGVLSNVLEQHGIATVALVSVLGQAQRMKAPRALYCDFPLGRPLGAPNDSALQHRVLAAALGLLDTPQSSVPLLATFDEVIIADQEDAASCPVPPRLDPNAHPAVDEARGLRAAYQRTIARTGRTSFGKTLTVDTVDDAVTAFIALADGTPLGDVVMPGGGNHLEVAADLRAYYEEAALSLTDGPTGPRATEAWLYEHTETGALLHRVQAALKDAGLPPGKWLYFMPMTRSRLF
jgi:hypothetical protein